MNPVLEKFNSIAKEQIETMDELEKEAKFLHLKVLDDNEKFIIYKRFSSCCFRGKDDNLHTINYYAMECGVRDWEDNVNNLVVTEYGLV